MRWIRLDVSFDQSWLFVLSPEAQLAWIKLLCHMKRDGVAGRCKAISPLVASRHWGIGEESVVKMLQAAVADGAITSEGGIWEVTNWAKFQDTDATAAQRMKRYRDKQRYAVTTVTDRNACHATETETETEKQPSVAKSAKRSVRVSPSPEECRAEFAKKGISGREADKFHAHYEANGWVQGKAKAPIKNWKAAAAGWILRLPENDSAPARDVTIPLDRVDWGSV